MKTRECPEACLSVVSLLSCYCFPCPLSEHSREQQMKTRECPEACLSVVSVLICYCFPCPLNDSLRAHCGSSLFLVRLIVIAMSHAHVEWLSPTSPSTSLSLSSSPLASCTSFCLAPSSSLMSCTKTTHTAAEELGPPDNKNSSTVTFLLSFTSGATICHMHLSMSVSCYFCLAQLRSWSCSRSMMMTHKVSLSHAARKWTDTMFSNFAVPKFLQIVPWLSSSSSQFAFFRLFWSSFSWWHGVQNVEASWVADCRLRCGRLCFVQPNSSVSCNVVSLLARPVPHDRLAIW